MWTRHGLSKRPEYRIWQAMIDRCHNERSRDYPNYGGRGIQVCKRWREDPAAFFDDVGPRPEGVGPTGHSIYSIEREDNDGNYEPGNCIWATRAEQNRNSRNVREITVGGVTKSVVEWADFIGLTPNAIYTRLHNGWSEEDAVTQRDGDRYALRSRRQRALMITFNGETLSAQQWADRTGINRTTIRERAKLGWPPEKILTADPEKYHQGELIQIGDRIWTIPELAEKVGLSTPTLKKRLASGWSLLDALGWKVAPRRTKK